MITLALAQMLFFVCAAKCQVHRWRRRPSGRAARQAVRRARSVQRYDHVLRGLVIVVLAFLLIVRTIDSPFGQVLRGIKEN